MDMCFILFINKTSVSCFFITICIGTTTPTFDVPARIGNNSVKDWQTRENHSDEIHQELRRAYLFEELLWRQIALTNRSHLRSKGHQFKDLVFECSFRGIDCR